MITRKAGELSFGTMVILEGEAVAHGEARYLSGLMNGAQANSAAAYRSGRDTALATVMQALQKDLALLHGWALDGRRAALMVIEAAVKKNQPNFSEDREPCRCPCHKFTLDLPHQDNGGKCWCEGVQETKKAPTYSLREYLDNRIPYVNEHPEIGRQMHYLIDAVNNLIDIVNVVKARQP